jgi:hypothetical protein
MAQSTEFALIVSAMVSWENSLAQPRPGNEPERRDVGAQKSIVAGKV